MTAHPSDGEALLTPAEVAGLFRVDPKTVTRWAKAGKLTSIRTLGGHRRYRSSEVHALLDRFAPEATGGAVSAGPVPPTAQRSVAPAPRQASVGLPATRVEAR
jgi:excisionase family DNA binding protein